MYYVMISGHFLDGQFGYFEARAICALHNGAMFDAVTLECVGDWS